jgi:hypothetical protein
MEVINFFKTSNRSVIASMNDMKFHISYWLSKGADELEVNQHLNTLPYKLNQYEQAVRVFREILSHNQ